MSNEDNDDWADRLRTYLEESFKIPGKAESEPPPEQEKSDDE